MFREIHFHSFRQFAAGKHDASSTTLALQPNIRAETHNRPIKGTAGVLLSQTEVIVEAEVGEHFQ